MQLIESVSTNEVCLKPVDTFPPAAPTRLVVLETPEEIVISWSESDSPDVEGYLVYRADERKGPYQRLTEEPIQLSSFTDANISPGGEYFYTVSAIDAAQPPNESERSSPIAATAPN